jgi:hypothetical protein
MSRLSPNANHKSPRSHGYWKSHYYDTTVEMRTATCLNFSRLG